MKRKTNGSSLYSCCQWWTSEFRPSAGIVSQANYDSLTALANFLKTKYNYDPGTFQGYSFASSSQKITARIDLNINSKNTLTLKYNYLRSNSEQPQSTSGQAQVL